MDTNANIEAELKARPITCTYTEFTPEQFQLRLSYAKQICEEFLKSDETITPEFLKLYEKYPMWAFYHDKNSKLMIKRSFGVAIDADGESVLHTQRAGLGFDNITLGGTLAKNLERVDQWTEEQIDFIECTPNPGIYLDPLGFFLILDKQAR